MKWLRLNLAYFNFNLVKAFYWSQGKLVVYWLGEDDCDTYADPQRENYLRWCRLLGVRPVEEENHG